MAKKFDNAGSGKAQRPPAGEPWIWITREVLQSDAWRDLGINARRLIDFLLLEHMGHGGRHNGRLKAPHRHLIRRGMSAGLIPDAIHEAEEAGLVIAHRRGLRVATTFTLTWLPLHDGHLPHPAWRKQESAAGSSGRAATTSGSRGAKSAAGTGGRSGENAATGSGGAIKRSSYQGSGYIIGSRYGEEEPDTEGPFEPDEFDT